MKKGLLAPRAAAPGPVIPGSKSKGADDRKHLRPQDERELVLAVGARDAGASAGLVDAFTASIGRVARIYRGVAGVDRAELMQAGVVGLLRAAHHYDSRIGAPFWAYASWWVRQAMQQHVAEMARPMVLSDRALRQLAQVRDARHEYMQSYQRDPSIPDLVEQTELTRDQVERLLASERTPRSLDEPVGDDGTGTETFEDLIEDPAAEDEYDRVLEDMQTAELRNLADRLAGRERTIVFAHYGLGCVPETLRQIAGHLDLSVERVRQLEERALGRIRDAALSPPRAVSAGGASP